MGAEPIAARRSQTNSFPGFGGNLAILQLRNLMQALPECRDTGQALRAIERAFVTTIEAPLAIFSKTGQILLHTQGFTPDNGDFECARSVMESGNALCEAFAGGPRTRHFLPLITWRGAVGALEFVSTCALSREMWPFVHSFASQAALTLLRSELADAARDAGALSEADQLQRTLLNSIAHNVRTPLASIIGALSTLQEDKDALDQIVREDLIDTARQEADRLNRLLGNLLDFSRIESRAVRIRADPCDVQDVIGAALEQLGAGARERAVAVEIDPDLPPVRMDFSLIVQVLMNMLDNSLKYSTPPTPIKIRAHVADGQFEVRVEDEGDGIDNEDLCRVFEKFNRARRTGETGGIGLGLSICKGLIEAHRGSIWAERRNPLGTAVVFRLPLLQDRDK